MTSGEGGRMGARSVGVGVGARSVSAGFDSAVFGLAVGVEGGVEGSGGADDSMETSRVGDWGARETESSKSIGEGDDMGLGGEICR